MRALLFATTFVLMSSSGIALADGPQTDLSLTGAQAVEMTTTDANACYLDSSTNTFNGEITDPASGEIISVSVLGTVGDHPAQAADGHAQLTMLAIDTSQDNPFINWKATGGTVTLDDVNTQVALDDGSASTHGALGHIDADMSSPLGAIHVSGPFACHLAG